MDQAKRTSVSPSTIIIMILLAALVILGCMTFEAQHTKAELQDTITELCGNAMKDIELNLRQGDDILPEHLYRFHEITQIYPDNDYARLAKTLLSLEDVSENISQADRDQLADYIAMTYDNDLSSDNWEILINQIKSILAPYLYP